MGVCCECLSLEAANGVELLIVYAVVAVVVVVVVVVVVCCVVAVVVGEICYIAKQSKRDCICCYHYGQVVLVHGCLFD